MRDTDELYLKPSFARQEMNVIITFIVHAVRRCARTALPSHLSIQSIRRTYTGSDSNADTPVPATFWFLPGALHCARARALGVFDHEAAA